jgi:hypothetical protein
MRIVVNAQHCRPFAARDRASRAAVRALVARAAEFG